MGWTSSHWGYTNLFIGVFINLCLKLFFRKYGFNFFETIIMLCFILGEGMLILSFTTLFFPLMSGKAFMIISSIFSYGYTIWSIGQFFDGTKSITTLKHSSLIS